MPKNYVFLRLGILSALFALSISVPCSAAEQSNSAVTKRQDAVSSGEIEVPLLAFEHKVKDTKFELENLDHWRKYLEQFLENGKPSRWWGDENQLKIVMDRIKNYQEALLAIAQNPESEIKKEEVKQKEIHPEVRIADSYTQLLGSVYHNDGKAQEHPLVTHSKIYTEKLKQFYSNPNQHQSHVVYGGAMQAYQDVINSYIKTVPQDQTELHGSLKNYQTKLQEYNEYIAKKPSPTDLSKKYDELMGHYKKLQYKFNNPSEKGEIIPQKAALEAKANTSVDGLQKEVDQIQKQLRASKGKLTIQRQKQAELKVEKIKAKYMKELQEMQDSKEKLQEELVSQKEEKDQQLQKLSQDLQNRQVNEERLLSELAAAKQSLANQEAEGRQSDEQRKAGESKIQALESQLRKSEEKSVALALEHTNMEILHQNEKNGYSGEIAAKAARIQELENEKLSLGAVHQKNLELENELSLLRKQKDELQSQANQAREQESLLNQYKEEIEKLQQELAKAPKVQKRDMDYLSPNKQLIKEHAELKKQYQKLEELQKGMNGQNRAFEQRRNDADMLKIKKLESEVARLRVNVSMDAPVIVDAPVQEESISNPSVSTVSQPEVEVVNKMTPEKLRELRGNLAQMIKDLGSPTDGMAKDIGEGGVFSRYQGNSVRELNRKIVTDAEEKTQRTLNLFTRESNLSTETDLEKLEQSFKHAKDAHDQVFAIHSKYGQVSQLDQDFQDGVKASINKESESYENAKKRLNDFILRNKDKADELAHSIHSAEKMIENLKAEKKLSEKQQAIRDELEKHLILLNAQLRDYKANLSKVDKELEDIHKNSTLLDQDHGKSSLISKSESYRQQWLAELSKNPINDQAIENLKAKQDEFIQKYLTEPSDLTQKKLGMIEAHYEAMDKALKEVERLDASLGSSNKVEPSENMHYSEIKENCPFQSDSVFNPNLQNLCGNLKEISDIYGLIQNNKSVLEKEMNQGLAEVRKKAELYSLSKESEIVDMEKQLKLKMDELRSELMTQESSLCESNNLSRKTREINGNFAELQTKLKALIDADLLSIESMQFKKTAPKLKAFMENALFNYPYDIQEFCKGARLSSSGPNKSAVDSILKQLENENQSNTMKLKNYKCIDSVDGQLSNKFTYTSATPTIIKLSVQAYCENGVKYFVPTSYINAGRECRMVVGSPATTKELYQAFDFKNHEKKILEQYKADDNQRLGSNQFKRKLPTQKRAESDLKSEVVNVFRRLAATNPLIQKFIQDKKKDSKINPNLGIDLQKAFDLESAPKGYNGLKQYGKLLGNPEVKEKCGRQLVTQMDALHSAGIIHRDIKLENVMIDDSGNCLIIDFGSAIWKKANASDPKKATLILPGYNHTQNNLGWFDSENDVYLTSPYSRSLRVSANDPEFNAYYDYEQEHMKVGNELKIDKNQAIESAMHVLGIKDVKKFTGIQNDYFQMGIVLSKLLAGSEKKQDINKIISEIRSGISKIQGNEIPERYQLVEKRLNELDGKSLSINHKGTKPLEELSRALLKCFYRYETGKYSMDKANQLARESMDKILRQNK